MRLINRLDMRTPLLILVQGGGLKLILARGNLTIDFTLQAQKT